MTLHFLGGLLGAIGGGLGKIAGGAAKAVAGGAKKMVGAGSKIAKAPALPKKAIGAARGVGGAGPRSLAGTLPSKPSFVGKGMGPRGFATKAPVKGGVGKKGTPSKGGKVAQAKASDQAPTTQKKESVWDKLKKSPAPALPQFTPDYGVQAAAITPQAKGLRPLKGMKEGTALVGGNPLHYHTHKEGGKAPKSETPKLGKVGTGKRSSKATLHYRSK